MRLCFDREGREVAVLVWREEELRLIGREAREVQGVDEENAENKFEKSPNHIEINHQAQPLMARA